MSGDEPHGWSPDDDPWEGMCDEHGYPFEIGPAGESAAQDVAAGAETPRLFNLPEEFWGARELFKCVRRQARADGTGPDAVLGAVLARAAGMAPHTLTFDSGKIGKLNLFVNIVGPTGIGKTEAMRSAQRIMLPPSYLADAAGQVDMDRFRDGVALGSGEGLAEIYMGTREQDTGEVFKAGPNRGDPKTERVRCQTRHNAFIFLDEGESLTRMLERRGATVGQALRTAWTGATMGAANAAETTTRFIPDGSYSMGILIGWQPKTAMALISDAAGGTPQRFLWLSTIDPDMPEHPDERPEAFRPPLCEPDGRPLAGVVHFPGEIKRALRADLRRKHVDGETVDELHSHEPLMRCKLAALLAVLDGRRMVDRDDWRFAGMIWQVSCAVRDRLVAFGEREAKTRAEAERARHVELAQAGEVARIEVSERVVAYARKIADAADAAAEKFETVGRSEMRRAVKYELRTAWDAGLEYAVARGWVVIEGDGARIAGTGRKP